VVSAEAVGGFAVIAGIAQEGGKGLAAVGLPDGGLELAVVGLGPSVHHEPQDQMAAGEAEPRRAGGLGDGALVPAVGVVVVGVDLVDVVVVAVLVEVPGAFAGVFLVPGPVARGIERPSDPGEVSVAVPMPTSAISSR